MNKPFTFKVNPPVPEVRIPWWEFQSIDTMKYSRDLAREKLNSKSFDTVIESQIKAIAQTGATHVGIATPYDEEFIPILERWVSNARKYGLNVWFRGNWSGWEGWFGYTKIDREEHISKTVGFIEAHGYLFRDGDVFSGCPECENGGPGDPRRNGDKVGHQEFLIKEYSLVRDAFRRINKQVQSNYNSMNLDVAKLIMDKKTTNSLGGIVAIDHYIKTPSQLDADITQIANQSDGAVVLGEFGAPIPDIHGNLTKEGQAKWIEEALAMIHLNYNLKGISYWVNQGGSTALWSENGAPYPGVDVLKKYFTPKVFRGRVVNQLGYPISGVEIKTNERTVYSDKEGIFYMPYINATSVDIRYELYKSKKMELANTDNLIILEKINPSLLYSLRVSLTVK